MAESLAPVRDPLATALHPGPWSAAAPVARALARSLAPEEASDSAPDWLRGSQVSSFRRVIQTLRRHRGALLADPVGSGKTFVALAAARVLNPGRATTCLVPAALVLQWRRTAESLGIGLVPVSHESVSRGHLPQAPRGLVLIDEAHRFRNPATHRYRTLAPWLAGRTVLLITATPVVNRLEDLLHQLLLAVRDDALRADGIASLREHLAAGSVPPALGGLVVESPARGVAQPTRRSGVSAATTRESAAAGAALQAIAGLGLSRLAPTAALVRSVLQRAAASSPAALAGALRRYRTLLLHARDACAAGRAMSRREIRRFTGELEEQLVWWELLAAPGEGMELDLGDIGRIDAAIDMASIALRGPDDKLARLRALLVDGSPTLVFTTRRDTVRYLRDRLTDFPLAWCTGARAGVGPTLVPRAVALGWFREGPGATESRPPNVRHLLVTDVAAEGLDLQRAARVVHYDLPWTPMRLEQREGRAVRLGSRHPVVEVVRFPPPAPLERALGLERLLARKARLPATAGVGPEGRALWRWRSEVAAALGGDGVVGVAKVEQGPAGVLGGFAIHGTREEGEVRLASVLLWVEPGGAWSEDESVLAARLAAASECRDPTVPDPVRLNAAVRLLSEPIRARLALVRGGRWSSPRPTPAAHAAALRVQAEIRQAARRRDAAGLATLERGLGFLAGGHTAGEAMAIERLPALSDGEFRRALARLPAPTPPWPVIEARLGGVVIFGDW